MAGMVSGGIHFERPNHPGRSTFGVLEGGDGVGDGVSPSSLVSGNGNVLALLDLNLESQLESFCASLSLSSSEADDLLDRVGDGGPVEERLKMFIFAVKECCDDTGRSGEFMWECLGF